jgi:hypothetical protein
MTLQKLHVFYILSLALTEAEPGESNPGVMELVLLPTKPAADINK